MSTLYNVIDSQSQEAGSFVYQLKLNASNHIFEGHFPQQPILPGVCQLKIIEELLERELNISLSLISASNIKYLKVVDPLLDKILHVDININNENSNLYLVKASMKFGVEVCLKCKLNFRAA